MKRLVLFALLALLVPATALADTITSGDLSFTCSGTCGFDGTYATIAPTSGSFTYDLTTNQFLSITVNWDGFTLGFSNGVGAPIAYLELIGSGLSWDALCTNDFLGFCGGAFDFELYDRTNQENANIFLVPAPGFVPEFTIATGGGTVTATDLVTTPEPETWILIIMVLVIGGSILGWKWAIDPKSRNHGKFHPRTLHQGTMRRPAPMH